MGHVLVTGATGGVGAAVATALLSADHRVTALGRDIGRLRELEADGAHPIAIDLDQVDDLEAAVDGLGELDALVHCAGVSEIASVGDTMPATWKNTLTVNVVAAAELTRLVLPALRRSRGHVMFVNAVPSMRGVPRWASFVGSKAALRELADSLRAEEAANGIRVTTISPAGTATDGLRRIRAGFGSEYDPARCIQPGTLASMIMWVLAAHPDAYATELTVQPVPYSR